MTVEVSQLSGLQETPVSQVFLAKYQILTALAYLGAQISRIGKLQLWTSVVFIKYTPWGAKKALF